MLTSTLHTIISTLIISALSFVGVFTLSVNEKTLHKILTILIAYSAGTILGAALFDLLPEAIALVDEQLVYPLIAFGFVTFLFLERIIYWYHGHGHGHEFQEDEEREEITKEFAYLNLIGDFIHNFIDGMIIASGFISGTSIGTATAIAVAFHELPQEMGDYGILVFAGIERRRALLLNLSAASSVIIGGLVGSVFINMNDSIGGYMVAFSAGAFIFLSASELIPEMHEKNDRGRAVVQLVILVLGMLTIYALGIVFP